MAPQPELIMTLAQLDQMVAHLTQNLPEEACGLAAGQDGRVELLLPVENILHSPVKYQMSPLEQFKAFQQFEKMEVELLAIYHSHPAGPPNPSATDLAEFAYPGTLVVIASPIHLRGQNAQPLMGLEFEGWWIRAFYLESQRFFEVKLGLAG